MRGATPTFHAHRNTYTLVLKKDISSGFAIILKKEIRGKDISASIALQGTETATRTVPCPLDLHDRTLPTPEKSAGTWVNHASHKI